ncbi:MAG: type II toxin-antitoxin system RelE/ParE family toxin [Planctomycetes bacterium]|nr:type II toxin-antitoxin system RelE/ParE family toxin [Planctomycetota bacterium]
MTPRVLITPEAERQARDVDRWWREHRPAAPGLFLDELAAAIELIGDMPLAGRRYGHGPVRGVRRILLRSTRYHVYYVVRRADALILAVWSAVRGTGPSLRR